MTLLGVNTAGAMGIEAGEENHPSRGSSTIMRLSLAFLLVFGLIVVACATTSKANFDDDDGFTGSGTSTGGAGGAGGASVNNATVGSTTDAASTVSVANSTANTVNTVSASTGPMSCLQDPDCPQCFCNQDPTGCNEYLNGVITHIYCGQSCGTSACSAFCTSMDPNQIDLNCDNCIQTVSQTDIDAFFTDCQASVACSNFVNQIIMCP